MQSDSDRAEAEMSRTLKNHADDVKRMTKEHSDAMDRSDQDMKRVLADHQDTVNRMNT